MRNDSKKLTKIIQKFLSLTDYVNTNSNLLIIFPNKFIDYDLSHLESRLSATERFIFDNTVSQNEALFQLPTILRATLCECCYTETRDAPIFMKELYRLYYRCSCVNNLFNYLIKGVKHGFQNLGCNSINVLHRKIDEDGLFIEIRTAPAQHEAGVHHLYSYNE